MEESAEAGEKPQGETQMLTNDPDVNQAISFLEEVVEAEIGVASDGKP